MKSEKKFKAGFVNIFGKPNVGKSTLVNALTGEKVSIVSHKPQTTRHRTAGILNKEDMQIIFTDTPGIIEPKYEMHKAMMRMVSMALEDADIIVYMVDENDEIDNHLVTIEKAKKTNKPVFLVINKIDLISQIEVNDLISKWSKYFSTDEIIPLSAIKNFNFERLLNHIIDALPEHPAYYDEDIFTDRPLRFLVSEIIREKIFLKYKQEIPYSVEVVTTSFKEEEKITFIQSEIFVNRKSQVPILIGNKGEALKRIGIAARKDIEEILQKQVHLEMFVKARENWRNNPAWLKQFGFDQ